MDYTQANPCTTHKLIWGNLLIVYSIHFWLNSTLLLIPNRTVLRGPFKLFHDGSLHHLVEWFSATYNWIRWKFRWWAMCEKSTSSKGAIAPFLSFLLFSLHGCVGNHVWALESQAHWNMCLDIPARHLATPTLGVASVILFFCFLFFCFVFFFSGALVARVPLGSEGHVTADPHWHITT